MSTIFPVFPHDPLDEYLSQHPFQSGFHTGSYVRRENSKYYVMMNENGRLKKRYIKTGKTVYGSVIEIKSGLDGSEYICFPYGKDVSEGKKCVNTDSYEDAFGY